MSELVLWGRRSAFNVQKVLWLLGELGVDFRHIEAGGAFGGVDTSEFLALNPHGRVPVLCDGAHVVWESHAILRYLAARYGGESLWPASPTERSRADQWMDWSQTTLQPAFMALFWSYYRTPAAQRALAGLQAAIDACDRLFVQLDGQLSAQAFVSGDEFSLGDIPAGATLYRYFEMGHEVPHHPHVDAWYRRLCSRSAYRSAVMLPFDELRGRTAY